MQLLKGKEAQVISILTAAISLISMKDSPARKKILVEDEKKLVNSQSDGEFKLLTIKLLSVYSPMV